ncbi:hypothetical protein NXY07_08330 [Phocaeicola dorei]|nr:hypothetical protein [Phocaeicola dorei]
MVIIKNVPIWLFGMIDIGEIEYNLYSLRTRRITDLFLANKPFAWRVDVHYWNCKLYHYPPNPTREWMIDFIIYAIIDIYKNGDIPHPYKKKENKNGETK